MELAWLLSLIAFPSHYWASQEDRRVALLLLL
jgi:hypothetical protein